MIMNKITNVGFIGSATILVSLGVETIATDLLTGVIEVILGLIVFAVYEYVPTKTQ